MRLNGLNTVKFAMSQEPTITEIAFKGSKLTRKASLKRKPLQVSKRSLKRTTGKIKPKGISKLKKKLDAVFSKYIRARDKHICYTCGLVMEPNRSQNGHFVPRQYLATRWDEINNHAQCYACNVLYNGQPSAYALRLEKDYGVGIVALLESKRKEVLRLTPDWYEEQIKSFAEKLKQYETS